MSKFTVSSIAAGGALVVSIVFFVLSESASGPIGSQDSNELGSSESQYSVVSRSHSDAGSAGSASYYGSDEPLILPEPPIEFPTQDDALITMWEYNVNASDIDVDGIPAKSLAGSTDSLAALRVGQQLEFIIPQRNRTVIAEIQSTHNQINDVHVFKGPIVGGHPRDNVILTRGKTHTYAVISTQEGIFSATINNATGQTTLIDEADISARQIPYEDGLQIAPVELTTPIRSTERS